MTIFIMIKLVIFSMSSLFYPAGWEGRCMSLGREMHVPWEVRCMCLGKGDACALGREVHVPWEERCMFLRKTHASARQRCICLGQMQISAAHPKSHETDPNPTKIHMRPRILLGTSFRIDFRPSNNLKTA